MIHVTAQPDTRQSERAADPPQNSAWAFPAPIRVFFAERNKFLAATNRSISNFLPSSRSLRPSSPLSTPFFLARSFMMAFPGMYGTPGTNGAGGNAGLNEQEQAMVKMVRTLPR